VGSPNYITSKDVDKRCQESSTLNTLATWLKLQKLKKLAKPYFCIQAGIIVRDFCCIVML
jgi:hypothetical protein